MRRFLARFSESEASNHTPSLADFTTTTPELKFSVHTGVRRQGLCDPAGGSGCKEDRRRSAGPAAHRGSGTPRLPAQTPQNLVSPSEISMCAETLRFESRRIEPADWLDPMALPGLDHSSLFRWLPR